MPTVVYTVKLDDKDILNELKKINTQLTKMESTGSSAFGKISGGAKMSALKLGGVTVALFAIKDALVNIAQQALETFSTIVQGGIEANTQLEATRISLTQIFEGNEGAADAFLGSMKTMAKRLRVPYQELAYLGKGILPDIGNIADTEKVLENFIILGRDAGQNFTSIRIALEEAMSGNTISMQKRLNIPAATIDRVKAMAEEVGMAKALVEVLGTRIQQAGLSIDAFVDSGLFAFGTIQAEALDLQRIMTIPIFEQLKDSAQELVQVFDENREEIVESVQAIGDLVADIVEFIASGGIDFLRNVDSTEVKALVLQFKDMLDLINLIVKGFGEFSVPVELSKFVAALNKGLEKMAENEAIGKALAAQEKAKADVYLPQQELDKLGVFGDIGELEKMVPKPLNALADLFNINGRKLEAEKAGLEAYNKVMEEYKQNLEETTQDLKDNRTELEKNTQAEKEASEMQKKIGEATLSRRSALTEIMDLEQQQADLKLEIDAKMKESQTTYMRDLEDAATDYAKTQLKIERDLAKDRADLVEKNAKKLRDLQGDYEQDIIKAERDYKYDLEDIDKESARKKEEIELEYQRKIQEIQASFQATAEEAERTQDAVGYLRAMRDRDRALEEAKQSREDDFTDAEKKREQDKVDAERHLADKLEDLRVALEREKEEQRIAYEYELQQQQEAEAQKRQDASLAYQDELDALALKNRRRLEDIKTALAAELLAYQEYEEQIKALRDRIREYEGVIQQGYLEQRMEELRKKYPNAMAPVGSTYRPEDLGTVLPSAFPGRASGGPVSKGSTYMVGEQGPELFVPKADGRIIPNNAFLSPNFGLGGSGGVTNNQVSTTFNLSESMMNDPIFVSQLRRMIGNELTKVLT